MEDVEFEQELQRIREVADTEPPRSNIFEFKYKARGELTALRTKLVDLAKAAPGDNALQQKCAAVHMLIAASMFETEEFAEGYEYLERAEDVLNTLRNGEPYDWGAPFKSGQLLELRSKMQPAERHADPAAPEAAAGAAAGGGGVPVYDSAAALLECFNMAGYCWSSRDTDKALKALRHSEKLYADWDAWAKRQGDEGVQSLHIADDGTQEEGASALQRQRAKMESHYTSTCFYFAQVFGGQCNTEEASKYCHLTLHRQLATKKEFDRVEWATNALGLCNFYLNLNDFGAAHYALRAAEKVLDQIADPKVLREERTGQTRANMHQAFAKWSLYWIKHHKDQQEGFLDKDEPDLPKEPVQRRVSWWVDFNLDIGQPSNPEPIAPPGTDGGGAAGWGRALEHFKEARRRYRKALEWFQFDGFVTDFISIQQDMSQLFRHLTHWDRDPADPFGREIDRHVALHAERLKLLEHIPGEISEKHYLNYQRQIWFECGEVLSETLELRLRQREHRAEIRSGRPVCTKRLNAISSKAYELFAKFCDSFRDKEGQMPSNLDPDLCSPYITARMHAVRLAGKRICSSPRDEYEMLETTMRQYQELVNWVKEHPDQKRILADQTTATQVEMAGEMVRLLPGKMAEIRKAFMRLA